MAASQTQDPTSYNDVNWSDAPSFINADTQHIFCRYWNPDGEIKAIVFINHGVGEHSRWYTPIAQLLTQQGFLVCAHDHVGNGLSEGDRVHISSFSVYIRDLMQHVNLITSKHQGLPVFLIGHSMGGTIVLQAGLDNPDTFKGIVLIAPAIAPNPQSATWIKVQGAKVAAWIYPQLQVGAIQKEWVSKDKAIRDAYEADPLNWHGGLKAQWASSMLQTMAKIQTRLDKIQWPFLLIHGDEDKLCEISGSKLMYEKAQSKDKTLKIYEGGYHQSHNEPDGQGEDCRQRITNWLAERI